MKRQNNPIVELRKYLNNQKDLGIFDNPSEELITQTSFTISDKVSRFFRNLLDRNEKYLTSHLKRKFFSYKKNFTKRHRVKVFNQSQLNPILFNRFKSQRLLALELIKTQNEENMQKLKRRFIDWVILKDVGDNKQTLIEMTKIPSNKHIKFILKDQTSKMINSFDKEVSDFYGGALAFQWKINNDNRVVGKPGGKNPKVTNPDMHGNHWHRRDKWYYNPEKKSYLKSHNVDLDKFEGDYNSNKDGMPGMPIGCRCWAYYIYDVDDLPKNMIRLNSNNK